VMMQRKREGPSSFRAISDCRNFSSVAPPASRNWSAQMPDLIRCGCSSGVWTVHVVHVIHVIHDSSPLRNASPALRQ
jgi:hypothetical protein